MSQENVEIARRAWEAASRKPKPDFATVNALYHPEHEFLSWLGGVEGRSYRGAQGFREWLATFNEAFEFWEMKLERVSAIDDSRVLIEFEASARSAQAGVPIEDRGAHILTIRNGKVTRTERFASPEEALQAAGLQDGGG